MKKIFITILSFFLLTLFYNYKKVFYCNGSEVLIKNIEGNSMYPLFKNGEKIDFMLDYYNVCNQDIKNGDIVAYDYSARNNLLIKQVKVTSLDNITLSGSNLIVNGEVLKNSVGEVYSFNEKEKNILGLYINNGKIPNDSYFIFGDNISESIDSRVFGAVSSDDILGKFKY